MRRSSDAMLQGRGTGVHHHRLHPAGNPDPAKARGARQNASRGKANHPGGDYRAKGFGASTKPAPGGSADHEKRGVTD
jgi:hypothetical protein